MPLISAEEAICHQSSEFCTTMMAPNASLHLITPTTLPSFRRILSLLLPVRYPDKFFAETLSDLTVATVSRVATWHEDLRRGRQKREAPSPDSQEPTAPKEQSTPEVPGYGTVIGGIRCRLESIPCAPSIEGQKPQCALYVQALALLSPYRGQGVATTLLKTVVEEARARHEGLVTVYAHVWEANTEGLEWYIKRGFAVEDGIVEGYYRRLKPDGARVVRRIIAADTSAKVETIEDFGNEAEVQTPQDVHNRP